MLIDTHAHLNFKAYQKDWSEIIKKCLTKKIWLINVGVDKKTNQKAIEIAKNYKKGVWAAVGYHPLSDLNKFNLEEIWQLAQEKKVVAIGEIGLDYYKNPDKEKQKEVFFQQLEIAQKLALPVILHCREAYDDLKEILLSFQSKCSFCPFACSGQIKGVVHCFSGNLKQAQDFIKMGLYLGFNGLITYSDGHRQLIEKIPLERILLETDCPFLAPEPYRGQRNSPLYLDLIAQKIAQIKEIEVEEVNRITSQNAQDLFNLSGFI